MICQFDSQLDHLIDPVVPRRRRLRDMQKRAGSSPAWGSLVKENGLKVFRQHTRVVSRKTGFDSRTDLSETAGLLVQWEDT
jgi:hypothetical protein